MVEPGDWSSLSTLILILVVLFVSLLVWLLISSCLGVPILRSISSVWDATLVGARAGGIQGAMARRRRELGGSEGEDWEMEYRRRPV